MMFRAVGVAVAAAAAAVLLGGPHLPDLEMATGQSLHLVTGGDTHQYLSVSDERDWHVWDSIKEVYNFGRWRFPPATAELHPLTVGQSYTQKKEWHYTGFASDNIIFGVATLQFGYASHAVMYVYDTVTGESESAKFEVLLAGRTLGATFSDSNGMASTVVSGCSKWTYGAAIEQCAEEGSKKVLQVRVAGTLTSGRPLSANITLHLAEDDMLHFVFPIGPRRPAIVSKVSGVSAQARLTVGDATHDLSGLGIVDWTRSVAARYTRWYWTAFAFVDAKTKSRVGVQVSSGVYEDERGYGMENALFVDGKLTMLDTRVTFLVPRREELTTQRWNVSGTNAAGDSVSYTFTPRARVNGEFHLGVLEGDLNHVWGKMTGRVVVKGVEYPFADVPGVIEDHYALW